MRGRERERNCGRIDSLKGYEKENNVMDVGWKTWVCTAIIAVQWAINMMGRGTICRNVMIKNECMNECT